MANSEICHNAEMVLPRQTVSGQFGERHYYFNRSVYGLILNHCRIRMLSAFPKMYRTIKSSNRIILFLRCYNYGLISKYIK